MSDGTLTQIASQLRRIVKQNLFKWRWGIELRLPRTLHRYVEGRVLPWEADRIQRLEDALAQLPKPVVKAAKVKYLFVAEDLRRDKRPHDGVAYEFFDKSAPGCLELSDPKWVGLHVSLFTDQSGDIEPNLQSPLLETLLTEELAHVWDYRLEEEGSRYASANVAWHNVAFNPSGIRRPFNIPNRRIYASPEEQNAEDWAAAVVWYIFRPDVLRRRARAHYEFVEQLFRRCLPP
jgi:hypothetical protein